jgi:ribonuclease HI
VANSADKRRRWLSHYGEKEKQRRKFSSAPRAAIAGAIGIVESLPPGSTVEIKSPDSFLVDAINKDLAVWRKAGWKKGDGKSVKNLDLFERLFDVITRRKLTVSARRCSIGGSEDGQRLQRLQDLASELRKKPDAA